MHSQVTSHPPHPRLFGQVPPHFAVRCLSGKPGLHPHLPPEKPLSDKKRKALNYCQIGPPQHFVCQRDHLAGFFCVRSKPIHDPRVSVVYKRRLQVGSSRIWSCARDLQLEGVFLCFPQKKASHVSGEDFRLRESFSMSTGVVHAGTI
jgi:hypothetical protein